MKVYQINVVCGSGSTGRIAVEIAKQIEAEGGQCRIAFGRGEAPRGVNAYKISGKWDVYYHYLMTKLTDRHGLYSKRATGRLIQDIRRFAPDIIHLHNIHGYYLNYEMLFAFLKEYGKPVKWTLHDCWAFTGHCAHYSAVGCMKWLEECNECIQQRQYPASFGADNSAKNFSTKKRLFTMLEDLELIVPSEWLRSQVEKSFLKKYSTRVIYNGLDLQVFRPLESDFRHTIGADEKKIILGVASVWSKRKGLEDFVKLQEILSDDYVIVLVGIDKKTRKKLPAEILTLERTEDLKQLVEIYSAADVFFNPSIEETMGLTTVEAIACGTPVVTYDKTAVPEVVPENGGIVLSPGNMEAVKAAIDTLLGKKTENLPTMTLQYEKEFQYKKYVELYKKSI